MLLDHGGLTGIGGGAGLLLQTYDSLFNIITEYGIKRVAIPSISTGIYRFPVDQAAKIAVSKASEYVAKNPKAEITFVCYDVLTKLTHHNITKNNYGVAKTA